MDEFKGTPGPWFVRFADDRMSMNMTTVGTKVYEGHNHYESELDTICIVFHQLDPLVSCEMEDFGDANARLISAAPDLLDKLAESRQKLSSLVHMLDKQYNLWSYHRQALYDIVNGMEVAIAKALGKEVQP